MTAHIDKAEFRILLVEDDPHALQQMKALLLEVLQRPVIDTAMTVEDGTALVERSRREGWAYHVALLDIKLPLTEGANPESDFTICASLGRLGVPIVHFTAYAGSHDIQEHMDEVHSRERFGDVPVVLIEKTAGSKWADRLLELLAPFERKIISRSIRERVEELIGPTDPGSGGPRYVRTHAVGAEERCGTHAMIQLFEDIKSNWRLLDEDARNAVKRAFAIVVVDENRQTVTSLSLLPLEDNAHEAQ